MIKKEFPILEFDEDKNAFIKPSHVFQPADITDRCVLCFFGEAIDKILEECPHRVVTYFKAESIRLPIYEIEYKGRKVVLLQAYVGAPGAAAQIEELTALGCRKYIACGGCGVLEKDIAVGHLIIPTEAVRDEGTSYHYSKPAREIAANERIVHVIENTLLAQSVPYIKAKTWTTDAVFRETPAKIQQRRSEGCVTVEMEASAYMAVSQYNNVDFGQILYAGDSLAGDEWDKRGWADRTDIREFVLRLALDACLNI
jgi:uridine phosphorylase